MYIKIIGSIFLMASTATMGFLKAEELNERVRRLSEFKRMIIFLQGELRFHRASLAEAFENVSERVEEPFASFLSETADEIEKRTVGGFGRVWDEKSGQLLREEGFMKEDGRIFELLKDGLGYLDLAMQTETLNLAILQAEDAIKTAKEQKDTKGRLYKTMGFTAGAFLTLLII